MKSSKKRDFTGKRVRKITVELEEVTIKEMVGLAPRESYGWIIEKLVDSAVRRKKKRNAGVMQNSVVN